jgi:hypothetical protein
MLKNSILKLNESKNLFLLSLKYKIKFVKEEEKKKCEKLECKKPSKEYFKLKKEKNIKCYNL